MSITISDLQQAMAAAMANFLNTEGLTFPCHLATIAANGWGSIMRYPGEPGKCITLAEHQEGAGLELPIHCLFLDSNGYSARVIVREKPDGN